MIVRQFLLNFLLIRFIVLTVMGTITGTLLCMYRGKVLYLASDEMLKMHGIYLVFSGSSSIN